MSGRAKILFAALIVAAGMVGEGWYERNSRAHPPAVSQPERRREPAATRPDGIVAPAPVKPVPVEPAPGSAAPNPESEPTRVQDFKNVGRGTPSAAYQTFIWAATTGQEEILDTAAHFQGAARERLDAMWAQLTDAERAIVGKPERLPSRALVTALAAGNIRMQILGISETPPDAGDDGVTAEWAKSAYGPGAEFRYVDVRIQVPGDAVRTKLTLWHDGQEWKIVMAAPTMAPFEVLRGAIPR